MDKSSKHYTVFTVGNLGFFKCDHMPFGLCNAPATFQQLMQNCLGELNLIYCLIYLDAIVGFLQTTEEHLHCLHIVFDQFREHNLKMKLSKCNFFREEITYLAHQVSKEQVWPSNSNLRAIAECPPPQMYTEVHVFLGLVGHYRIFIKGFTCIAQLLNKHLTGEGASRKSEQVLLSEDALNAFEALKQACMTAPILAFTDYTKPFLLGTDVSKDGLGQCCHKSRQTDDTTPSSMAAEPLHITRRTITWLSSCFSIEVGSYRAFQGIPTYQSLLVKTDTNPMTYIMMTPNLDPTGHQWVGALVQFNFELEYQKGHDNTVVDALSWVTTQLDPDTVRSNPDGVALG